MINYSSILQTGIQSLLAVASGWACGRWKILDAEPTVAYTNTLVLKFCIPCLQVWLLAIKTDMRDSGNWSAMFAFLFWSLSLQVLLAVMQLLWHDKVHFARLGVDSLILTTNNTGILGPVVLQAAVGPQYAPLGMLATVVLYFQQLPSAQLLFQLHQQHLQQQQQQQQWQLLPSDHLHHAALPVASSRSLPLQQQNGIASKQQQLKQQNQQQKQQRKRGQPPASWQELEQLMKNPEVTYEDIFGGSGNGTTKAPHTSKQPARLQVPSNGGALNWRDSNGGDNSGDQQQQQQQYQQPEDTPLPQVISLSSWELQQAYAEAISTPPRCKSPFSLVQQPAAAAAQHASIAQSMGNCSSIGDPEQLPLSTVSFETEIEECEDPGSPELWGSGSGGKQQQRRQQQQQQRHKNAQKWDGHHVLAIGAKQSPFLRTLAHSKGTAGYVCTLLLQNPLVWSTGISLLLSCLGSSMLLDPDSPLALQHLVFIEAWLAWFAQTTAPLTLFTTGLWMYSNSIQPQQGQGQGYKQHQQGSAATVSDQLPWVALCYYLLARATVAPGFMVFVCWLMRFQGDFAHALVILALLPVAQTAFVVCKQAETGTHAVSVVMVASLLLMLPQLMVMLALLEWLGVFA